MKAILSSILLVSSITFAGPRDFYRCVADSLQAINSDIYYDLDESTVRAMLTIPEMMGHNEAVSAAKRCEAEVNPAPKVGPVTDADYQCIADRMQALNSSIYYDLDKETIDQMLQIPELMGHIDAVNAARACGVL